MRYLRIFLQMTAANLRGLMSFKVDFLVSFFAGFLSQTIGLVFLGVLFQNIPEVAGWNVYEVALLYGYMFVSEGILTLFFQGTNGLWRQVRIGNFDRYMVRPLPVTLQIYGLQTNLAGAGTSVTGLVVILYSLGNLDLVFPWWKVVLLVASLVLGAVIRVNINFASSCIAVITQGGIGGTNTIYKIQELAKYPMDIYPRVFRVILVSLIPFAAISYIPAVVVLDRADPLFWLALPVATVLIVVIRKGMFYKALNCYEGAGN